MSLINIEKPVIGNLYRLDHQVINGLTILEDIYQIENIAYDTFDRIIKNTPVKLCGIDTGASHSFNWQHTKITGEKVKLRVGHYYTSKFSSTKVKITKVQWHEIQGTIYVLDRKAVNCKFTILNFCKFYKY